MAKKINIYRGPYHWFLQYFFNKRYIEPINLIRKSLNKRMNVLDIGCGDGKLTSLIAPYVKSVKGVDNQKIAVEFAKLMSKNIKNITFGVDSGISLHNNQKFDVVTSFDVIEHIQKKHVNSFLKNCNKSLRKKGILILSTPNKRDLRSRVWGHKLDKKHYQEFDKKSLEKVVSQNGFKIKKIYGVYIPFPIPNIEHFASVIPLRYFFILLIKLGRYLPTLSVKLVLLAQKE